jgi:hypothetical protein
MEKIIILSKNSGIVSKDELSGLALGLKGKLNNNIEFSTPKQLGTQVTLHDVIEIWLVLDRLGKTETGKKIKEKISDKIIDLIVSEFLDWAKKRMKTEKKKRPKSLKIIESDEKLLKSITLDEDDKLIENVEKDFIPMPPKDAEPFDDFDE